MIHHFATRYSAWVHSMLVSWNLIVGFWIGSQEFRNEIAGFQHMLHLPTWTLVLFTGLINITLAYRAWNKQR
jgi:hypothetical protein